MLYDSSGIIEEGEEPEFLRWMDYEYDENGTLRQRQYYHNSHAFSTSYRAWSRKNVLKIMKKNEYANR